MALSTSSVCYAGLLLVVSCAHILLQLYSALQHSLDGLCRTNDELQASRARIVAAADAERRRIERDLHDGAQQNLTSLAVKLLLAATLAGQDPVLAGLLEELGAELKDTAQGLRSLVHGIYPPLLRENGLAAALADAARLSTLPTTVWAASLGRYPADIEAAVYFCCLEAMQNACKHAGEPATIRLRVREEPGTLRFEVTDDGAGFDTGGRGLGAGLRNMADRMGAFGGRLLVESAPGEGTRVTGTVPVPVATGQRAVQRVRRLRPIRSRTGWAKRGGRPANWPANQADSRPGAAPGSRYSRRPAIRTIPAASHIPRGPSDKR